MTDARADALTAPTADPGIVAALVYVGDQIAAHTQAQKVAQEATGADLSDPQAQSDHPDARPVERRTGPHAAQHPTDRHLLPKEDQ